MIRGHTHTANQYPGHPVFSKMRGDIILSRAQVKAHFTIPEDDKERITRTILGLLPANAEFEEARDLLSHIRRIEIQPLTSIATNLQDPNLSWTGMINLLNSVRTLSLPQRNVLDVAFTNLLGLPFGLNEMRQLISILPLCDADVLSNLFNNHLQHGIWLTLPEMEALFHLSDALFILDKLPPNSLTAIDIGTLGARFAQVERGLARDVFSQLTENLNTPAEAVEVLEGIRDYSGLTKHLTGPFNPVQLRALYNAAQGIQQNVMVALLLVLLDGSLQEASELMTRLGNVNSDLGRVVFSRMQQTTFPQLEGVVASIQEAQGVVSSENFLAVASQGLSPDQVIQSLAFMNRYGNGFVEDIGRLNNILRAHQVQVPYEEALTVQGFRGEVVPRLLPKYEVLHSDKFWFMCDMHHRYTEANYPHIGLINMARKLWWKFEDWQPNIYIMTGICQAVDTLAELTRVVIIPTEKNLASTSLSSLYTTSFVHPATRKYVTPASIPLSAWYGYTHENGSEINKIKAAMNQMLIPLSFMTAIQALLYMYTVPSWGIRSAATMVGTGVLSLTAYKAIQKVRSVYSDVTSYDPLEYQDEYVYTSFPAMLLDCAGRFFNVIASPIKAFFASRNQKKAQEKLLLGLTLENRGKKEKAFDLYKEAAVLGLKEAQRQYGIALHKKGKREEAIKFWKEAAVQEDVIAQYILGVVFPEEIDEEQAKQWEQIAIDEAAPEILSVLGGMLYKERESKKAEPWLIRAADARNPKAQNDLCVFFLNEYGDIEKAYDMGRKAAKQGITECLDSLQSREASLKGHKSSSDASSINLVDFGDDKGFTAVFGSQAEIDFLARTFLERASNKRKEIKKGDIGYKNQERDAHIEELVASLGDWLKDEVEKELFRTGMSLLNKDNIKHAFQQLADRGNAVGQHELGWILENEGNDTEAEKLYREASEQGFANSQYNLGVLLQRHDKTEEAEFWYEKAIEQGNLNAQRNLAHLLIKTRGDRSRIWGLLQNAAMQNHSDAQNDLGVFLLKLGRREEAIEWFKKSVAQGYLIAKNNLEALFVSNEPPIIYSPIVTDYLFETQDVEEQLPDSCFEARVVKKQNSWLKGKREVERKLYQDSVDQGNANSQNTALKDKKTVMNVQKELQKWLEETRWLDQEDAQCDLGTLCKETDGAMNWCLANKANQKDMCAQYYLGANYLGAANHLGVEEVFLFAADQIKLAAAQGHILAGELEVKVSGLLIRSITGAEPLAWTTHDEL